jgi:protein-L-isoaspartate(D-aspartate) O-methyltransferase
MAGVKDVATRIGKRVLPWAAGLLLCALSAAAAEPEWQLRRQALIDEIRADVADTENYTGLRKLDERVMAAMNAVPRHEFVLARDKGAAYENRPLSIGYGQTISQPYIVALMTELLRPKPDHVVLEVGTGSGYQAAVLGELVRQVYTIEIIEPLATAAAERLRRLNYRNVTVKHADGYDGWPEHGPFDGIIVTAAGAQIPPPLVRQLKPGGRMILPVGSVFTAQYLVLVTKDAEGHVSTEQLLPVMFVPLTGER